MRIVVVSDTHRDFRTLLQIVEKHKGEAAYFLHLGDGEQEGAAAAGGKGKLRLFRGESRDPGGHGGKCADLYGPRP